MAHCEEDFLAQWLNEVDNVHLDGRPINWNVSVYERCGREVSPKYSTFQRNLGSEECTAYLKYIVDRYDDGLPEIVYFLQPDALSHNPEKGHQHTSFSSLQKTLVTSSAPPTHDSIGNFFQQQNRPAGLRQQTISQLMLLRLLVGTKNCQ